ncbi:uncharacterized protein LOC103935343 [Pyrus x bretschneideri]|uniref:uncharacterized protein LOC103935343 n=1 Tax=Pyrus x bretschneideri TaxID=225117 RepID=UPI0005113DB6|nr:uncharacterized protein LOC103935343 [Pyrus x bretschneideri]
MNVLDSNLEALAVNYLSFGLFTTTWVAVLTAAISFWRLRPRAAASTSSAISSSSSSSLSFRSQPAVSDLCLHGSSPVSEITQSDAAAKKVDPPCSVPSLAKFNDSRVQLTKGSKFAVYFEDSNVESDIDLAATSSLMAGEDEMEGSGSDEVVVVANWWDDVLRLRTGEMGWYRFQDLTELNGNVVRLWDD